MPRALHQVGKKGGTRASPPADDPPACTASSQPPAAAGEPGEAVPPLAHGELCPPQAEPAPPLLTQLESHHSAEGTQEGRAASSTQDTCCEGKTTASPGPPQHTSVEVAALPFSPLHDSSQAEAVAAPVVCAPDACGGAGTSTPTPPASPPLRASSPPPAAPAVRAATSPQHSQVSSLSLPHRLDHSDCSALPCSTEGAEDLPLLAVEVGGGVPCVMAAEPAAASLAAVAGVPGEGVAAVQRMEVLQGEALSLLRALTQEVAELRAAVKAGVAQQKQKPQQNVPPRGGGAAAASRAAPQQKKPAAKKAPPAAKRQPEKAAAAAKPPAKAKAKAKKPDPKPQQPKKGKGVGAATATTTTTTASPPCPRESCRRDTAVELVRYTADSPLLLELPAAMVAAWRGGTGEMYSAASPGVGMAHPVHCLVRWRDPTTTTTTTTDTPHPGGWCEVLHWGQRPCLPRYRAPRFGASLRPTEIRGILSEALLAHLCREAATRFGTPRLAASLAPGTSWLIPAASAAHTLDTFPAAATSDGLTLPKRRNGTLHVWTPQMDAMEALVEHLPDGDTLRVVASGSADPQQVAALAGGGSGSSNGVSIAVVTTGGEVAGIASAAPSSSTPPAGGAAGTTPPWEVACIAPSAAHAGCGMVRLLSAALCVSAGVDSLQAPSDSVQGVPGEAPLLSSGWVSQAEATTPSLVFRLELPAHPTDPEAPDAVDSATEMNGVLAKPSQGVTQAATQPAPKAKAKAKAKGGKRKAGQAEEGGGGGGVCEAQGTPERKRARRGGGGSGAAVPRQRTLGERLANPVANPDPPAAMAVEGAVAVSGGGTPDSPRGLSPARSPPSSAAAAKAFAFAPDLEALSQLHSSQLAEMEGAGGAGLFGAPQALLPADAPGTAAPEADLHAAVLEAWAEGSAACRSGGVDCLAHLGLALICGAVPAGSRMRGLCEASRAGLGESTQGQVAKLMLGVGGAAAVPPQVADGILKAVVGAVGGGGGGGQVDDSDAPFTLASSLDEALSAAGLTDARDAVWEVVASLPSG